MGEIHLIAGSQIKFGITGKRMLACNCSAYLGVDARFLVLSFYKE